MKLKRSIATALGAPALLAASMLVAPATAVAGPGSCDSRTNSTSLTLLECVTLEGVRSHQKALQDIADANGGTRAAGTVGYDQSVAYVVGKMTKAGYSVTLNPFPFVYQRLAELRRIAPNPATLETNAFVGTGFGTATGGVTPVDIQLGLGNTSTSGCEAADFAGFPAGRIALIQRGTCAFAIKALNAQAAGAIAVIIFNQGNTTAPDRNDVINGTLAPDSAQIPVVAASYADGATLVQQAQVGLTMSVSTFAPQNVTQYNVIAESLQGDANNVVMVGAHLDSVQRGPGINDNGSGSAAILEVAIQMAKVKPRNKLRFAWWGGEEAGLVGSTAYVSGLSDAQKDQIALYLNFDMVGSPNHVFFIYDGDNSDGVGSPAGPPGSGAIEKVFESYFTQRNIPFKGTDFTGRSDYGPFIAVGIPAGGLFTGAEGLKTAEEQSIWGGTAGAQYDTCYHQACDTFANVNTFALDVNADTIAYAVLTYAASNQSGRAKRAPFKYDPEFWGPSSRK